jgi:hypothetical protein
MRGIARVGRRGPKALKRREFRRPWDASEGVSKPWRCPASPPDRPAPCFLPDATQGRSLGVSIIKIWYKPPIHTVFRISRPVADTLTRVSGRDDWRQVSALEPISLERRRSWGHRATVITPGSRVTIRARAERPGSASCAGPLKHPSSPVPPRWRHSETGRAR